MSTRPFIHTHSHITMTVLGSIKSKDTMIGSMPSQLQSKEYQLRNFETKLKSNVEKKIQQKSLEDDDGDNEGDDL